MSEGNGARLDELGPFGVLPPLDPPPAPSPGPGATGRAKPKGVPDRHRAKGRFATVNAFLDVAARDLELSQIVVWLLLWRDVKSDGLARTSQADLARRSGLNPRTVRRAVRALAATGLLTVVRCGNLRTGPTAYRVRPLPQRA
jgi:hypothetical protein